MEAVVEHCRICGGKALEVESLNDGDDAESVNEAYEKFVRKRRTYHGDVIEVELRLKKCAPHDE